MEYQDFLQCVQERTQKTAGEGGSVTVNHVIKNNGCELDGLVIMEKGCSISPTIYLNSFYEEYLDGRVLEDIVGEIQNIYINNKDRISVDPQHFHDFEIMKSKIVYKIINYEKNKKLLENIPFKRVLDLAVVFYCLLEQQDEGNATALIYNSHMEAWKVNESDIFEAAVRNTPRLLKSVIRPMSSIIREMMLEEGSNCKEIETDFVNEREWEAGEWLEDEQTEELAAREMFVLTNKTKINGASCILYENVLEDFATKINSDLYILPSSIHEVILLPKLASFNREELKKMVCEVNCEGVAREEVLSDNVYIYNRADGMISM